MICHFCEDIFALNREQGLPEGKSIIYQDENIFVMPDISPLAVGHMLIVAHQHYQSYASAKPETWRSVRKFLKFYEQQIGSDQYTILEHGAVVPYHAGASIDHAHIHILPFLLPISKDLERNFGKGIYCTLEELSKFANQHQPYLYHMFGTQQEGAAFPVGEIKSQYLRELIHRKLSNNSVYDWKQLHQQPNAHIDFYKTLIWWNGLNSLASFKWEKKLLMVKYDLTDYHSLIKETTRFQPKQKALIQTLLEKELQCDRICRIVLVPMRQQYKLPNYIVKNKNDLNGLDPFFDQCESCEEIWYFSEASSPQPDRFCGRISYNRVEYGTQQIIEIVNGDSPRQLEKFVLKNQEMDYLRFVKKVGSHSYHIDDIHLGIKQHDLDGWLSHFNYLQQALRIQNESLHQFWNMVQQYQVQSLSLDFQVRNHVFSLIDWDSSNDFRIVEGENFR